MLACSMTRGLVDKSGTATDEKDCVSLVVGSFSSWGAVRVMGSGKVSRMLLLSFIGKYKPMGNVFGS